MNLSFASDNYAGVHPEIMDALIRCNIDHAASYGSDEYTDRAIKKFKAFFGEEVEVFFVYNGTGANVLGLSSLTKSFHSVLCTDLAHIQVDESTAPEKFTGCKLQPIPTKDGKLYPEDVERSIERIGDQHHAQARVISVSQATEFGTVYTSEQIKALSDVANRHNLYLHMDGSRIANAAVSLGKAFQAFTRDAGVDVLSFGGTKNGMMFGEAVLIFRPELAHDFNYIRKQGMQLHSKMRFIGAQFDALLSNDLWSRSASHANGMAKLLEREIRNVKGVRITQSVDANGVFVQLPRTIIPALQEESFFYIWNEQTSEARLMCSFTTTTEQVLAFAARLKQLC
jgi:threonine aldolase